MFSRPTLADEQRRDEYRMAEDGRADSHVSIRRPGCQTLRRRGFVMEDLT